MNSPTQHYVKLRESLKKAEVITRGIDRRECKTELQHLKLQAYVLLCHSALEEYIEDLGLSVAQQARSLFSNSGLITRALVALISSRLVDELSEKGKRRVTSISFHKRHSTGIGMLSRQTMESLPAIRGES